LEGEEKYLEHMKLVSGDEAQFKWEDMVPESELES